MERLIAYFEQARVCGQIRRIGIETETLFVDQDYRPISYPKSQSMMKYLQNLLGWRVAELRNNVIVRLEKNGFAIFYELGWNNFELTTPVYDLRDDVFSEHKKMLGELYQAGRYYQAQPIVGSGQGCWDNYLSNTLIIPDQRDKVWIGLDGEALYVLGHIAAVHFNVDLRSIQEGMDWIRRLNTLFIKIGWPPPNNFFVWRKYIRDSLARYDERRYGPAPEDFWEYCRILSSFKLVMDCNSGDLQIVRPPLPFYRQQDPDIDLFLRSVWWYPRLRVRNGNLVLEIRDVPRGIDLAESFGLIREELGF